MSEQRRGAGLSRRDALRGAAALAGGTLGGCLGVGSAREPVSVLAAGSLANALENGLEPAVEPPLQIEAYGSAEVARLVAGGHKDPAIVSVADVALFDGPLRPPWYAEFATNAVVLAYNPETKGGRRIADADAWYEPLLAGDVALGRTDPDLDPLGYRALFVLDLAARYYGVPDLRERVLARKQVYPETQLMAGFETGALDAAIVYRSMAADRGYEYVSLPPEIDLSDPARAEEWYETVSYALPGGTTVRGAPISYASTLRRRNDDAATVFRAHVGGDYLRAFGFSVPDDYPRYSGDVPDAIAD